METEPARLLVVDDSLTIRRALEFILKPCGYALEFAADGGEALDQARSFQPDLILLDYVLPDMRGPDVCSALEAIAATSQTPVILVSAKGASIRQAYQDAQNVVSYITKPFKPQVVLSVVEKALSRTRPVAPTIVEPVSSPREETVPPPPLATPTPVTLSETFSALLGQLEDAVSAETRQEVPAPRTLARLTVPLRRAREQLREIGQHIEEDGVAPYRLRPDGSFANVAATLLETHRLLCEATLALAATGAPGPDLPSPPDVLVVVPTDHPSHPELAERSRRPGVLLVERDWSGLGCLMHLVRPKTVVTVDSLPEPALTSLGALRDPPRRIVLTAAETDLSGTPLVAFERFTNLEALSDLLGPPSSPQTPEPDALGLEVVNL